MWWNCIQLQKEMMKKMSSQKDSDSDDEEDENANYMGDLGFGISRGFTFGAHLAYAQVADELGYGSLN